MKWSLLELNKYKEKPCVFSYTLDVKTSLMKREPFIEDVAPVNISGQISVNENDYLLNYEMETVITVPSSRSLLPVKLPLHLQVNETFMTKEQAKNDDDFADENLVIILEHPTIDLTESVEDNILLSIPLQVLTDEEKNGQQLPNGNDWTVLSEEDYFMKKKKEINESIDPRLAELSKLLEESNNSEDN